MPELLSHCTVPHATVANVLARGLASMLAPRLSTTAMRQCELLLTAIRSTMLSSGSDKRTLPLCSKPGGKFHVAALHELSTDGGERSPHYKFVWKSHVPSRVSFFAWLLVNGRLQCRANLVRKNILSAVEGGCPICPAALETTSHIMLECTFATSFWRALGAHVHADNGMQALDACALPLTAPPRSAAMLRLLCYWHLWKHRNDVVFNGLAPSLPRARKSCSDDAVLWRSRLPTDAQADVDLWLTYLQPIRY
ncbi:unnamed protein product [Alopecurus aequalis]